MYQIESDRGEHGSVNMGRGTSPGGQSRVENGGQNCRGTGASVDFGAALPHRYFSPATDAKTFMIVANQDGGR